MAEIPVKQIERPLSDQQRLARIAELQKAMLSCECSGLCWDCTERLAKIGELANG
jgi:uncharacterized ParB-like nuclease family protein